MTPRRVWKVFLDWQLREAVKVVAAKADVTIGEYVEAAIREYLAKDGDEKDDQDKTHRL